MVVYFRSCYLLTDKQLNRFLATLRMSTSSEATKVSPAGRQLRRTRALMVCVPHRMTGGLAASRRCIHPLRTYYSSDFVLLSLGKSVPRSLSVDIILNCHEKYKDCKFQILSPFELTVTELCPLLTAVMSTSMV